jgi:Holliday junction resolvasome RuvABC DNA-binding subunit
MIDMLTGQVAAITNQYLVLTVGGVGLRVNVPTTIRDVVT